MNDTLTKLIEILEQDERLVVDGKLAKNKVVELALELDVDLLRLLKKSKELVKVFFQEVDGILIFDKIKFQSFVSNKEFLPGSFTEYKNKIGLMASKQYLTDSNEVVLAFPYKDCVLEGGQDKDEAKRDEVFWNETLAPDEVDRLLKPKILTNIKKYVNGKEVDVNDITIDDNLVIKGNNLLSLYSLKNRYQNKVKFIYIDPPFNTPGDANTFAYNNTFNHSTWLIFMKNRLEIARQLLSYDGVIAIAIDDTEQAYLRVLCDQVFHKENFIGTLIIETKPSGRTSDAYFATSHEYVHFYSRNPQVPEINFSELTEKQKEKYKEGDGDNAHSWRDFLRTGGYSTPEERPNSYYPIYFSEKLGEISLDKLGEDYVEILPIDTEGKKRVWRKTRPSFMQHIERGEIRVVKNPRGDWKVKIIDRIKLGLRPKSVWVGSKYDASSHGTKLLKNIFSGQKLFSYPKSIFAVSDVIKLFTERDSSDIVMDFFGGSGTTAHAVLMLNKEDNGDRKFIICEQMDYVKKVTRERIRKVTENDNSGSFVYAELAKANQTFVDVIQDAKTTKELGVIWEKMKETAFLSYKIDVKEIDETKKEWSGLSLDDQKRFLVAVLEKNWLYVPYSEIDDERFTIPENVKRLNRKFYE